jgi:hypothetical protein
MPSLFALVLSKRLVLCKRIFRLSILPVRWYQGRQSWGDTGDLSPKLLARAGDEYTCHHHFLAFLVFFYK